MKVRVHLDGGGEYGTPLIMHSEVLADKLSDQARWVAELSGKRKRTEAEEIELSRREWVGGMYYDETLGPVLPTWNIVRSIQDGARMTRHGKTIERGVFPCDEIVPLQYDGPRDLDGLWKSGEFSFRKGVKLSGKKVQRTRPIFHNWQAEAELTVDPFVVDFQTFEHCVMVAGRYHGIGDFRSGRYGRYVATVTLLDAEIELIQAMDEAFSELDKQTTQQLVAAAARSTRDHEEKNQLAKANGKTKK